jgi:hypothetical protein
LTKEKWDLGSGSNWSGVLSGSRDDLKVSLDALYLVPAGSTKQERWDLGSMEKFAGLFSRGNCLSEIMSVKKSLRFLGYVE